jgi:DNA-binding response OmpR family regulator
MPAERVVVGELHLIRARLDQALLGLASVAVSAAGLDDWGRVEEAARLARRALVAAVGAAPPLPEVVDDGLVVAGELRVDVVAGRQWWGDREFELSPLHHRLLAVMAAEPYRVFGKDELAGVVWCDPAADCSNAVKTSVSRLRRALVAAGAPSGAILCSRHGIGWGLFSEAASGSAETLGCGL